MFLFNLFFCSGFAIILSGTSLTSPLHDIVEEPKKKKPVAVEETSWELGCRNSWLNPHKCLVFHILNSLTKEILSLFYFGAKDSERPFPDAMAVVFFSYYTGWD